MLLNNLSKKHTFSASYDGPAQIVVLETENSKQKGFVIIIVTCFLFAITLSLNEKIPPIGI